jgi:mannose/cellobiose epimerase-like protein (N-acyl-D-glucosamine 2-epimerase family)
LDYFNVALTALGTVKAADPQRGRCELALRTGDTLAVQFGVETAFSVLTNADNLDRDKVAEPGVPQPTDLARKIAKYVRVGDTVFVRGILQEHRGERRFDGRQVTLLHHEPGRFLFEETHWWLTQTSRLADAWLDDLFGDARSYREDDFSALYRTNLNILGGSTDDNLQATATLSRLIYGLSSSYLLTGDNRYRAAAAAGTEFQRSAFRSMSHDSRYCFWAYGRRKRLNDVVLIMGSEASDDWNSIALYEQIYALAGMTQYYRISNDPMVLEDIRRTIATFNDFFLDLKSVNPEFPGLDGYFSHIDPATMRPDTASLGPRAMRKNWNSVGDHIPAYLLNLLLALDPMPQGASPQVDRLQRTCKEMLDRCTRLIIEKLPDPEVPYVNERFFADWKPDHEWGWQKDRAIVGHNYKIAWNLTRVANYYLANNRNAEAEAAMVLARRLGKVMRDTGADLLRGGCWDAVERHPSPGQPLEFVWGNTKDFWQQEQAILANLILYGYTKEPEYLDHSRLMSAFWNAFFLDRDRQGVYFRVSENGSPVVEGQYSNKSGYSIAGYHTFELNYLAHIYTRAYVAPKVGTDDSFCIYFRPCEENNFRSINVAPDALKPGTVEIEDVYVRGRAQKNFVPDRFQIPIEDSDRGAEVVVVYRTKGGQ